jgi:hypothetical protein
MEMLANIGKMWLGEEVKGEMMAGCLEVIYRFKSILISQIFLENSNYNLVLLSQSYLC